MSDLDPVTLLASKLAYMQSQLDSLTSLSTTDPGTTIPVGGGQGHLEGGPSARNRAQNMRLVGIARQMDRLISQLSRIQEDVAGDYTPPTE